MNVSGLLQLGSVRVVSSVSSKKRLFHEIGDMATGLSLDGDGVIEALMEREALGPTGVGHGVALPHARLADLTSVVGLFLRLEKPLDFDAVDRQPVDLVFCLLAPEDAGVDHLKALALVSRTLRDEDVRTKLRANSDAATLHAILTEVQSSPAAA